MSGLDTSKRAMDLLRAIRQAFEARQCEDKPTRRVIVRGLIRELRAERARVFGEALKEHYGSTATAANFRDLSYRFPVWGRE